MHKALHVTLLTVRENFNNVAVVTSTFDLCFFCFFSNKQLRDVFTRSAQDQY